MSWTLRPAREFARHAEDWSRLHAALAPQQASSLLAAAFVAPLVASFGRGDELLACLREEGRIRAMAIVHPSRRGAWSTFQPAQAPVGLWLQEEGLDTATAARSLLGTLPGFPLLLALTQMDPHLSPRPQDGPLTRTLDYIDTARVTLDGSFDDYWNARGKNLRGNLKKQRARLEREGVTTRMVVDRAPAAMAQAVSDYGRLETAGWKGSEGTAVSSENAQGRYYRAMLEGMAANGAASVYRYYFGEQLVAMDLCVEDGDSIVVLKTAYDESVPSNLSPTLLMREEATRKLFEAGRFTRLEFYGRVMEWHTRWTEEVRTMYHVNYYRWPGLARLHGLLEARSQARSRTSSPAAHTTTTSL
ncbi:GNAT family N-acetyltransferase [Massilia sp. Mn16-1_5]|uniref:GNAT family N-acetyltransferase n=1 Tax=Massilia sp. Mn16-1_5 TaxID=2079199 RepID=UPI00109EA7F0|nr:GNAT family N-acetyltransferase [Massilia sp. Mn16-1_5]THC41688.1 GNAT family N-acetyltransferase [Massilia sp. Mn16-1_5]